MTITNLMQEPSEFDFYQAVYAVEKQLSAEDKKWLSVGKDSFPAKELVRFKVDQSSGFPGRPISKVALKSEQSGLKSLDLHVTFMGLTGPNGVLPRHYSELMLQCIKNRDTAMRDFFDLFNHRLISLYYRAWKKYRAITYLDSSADDIDLNHFNDQYSRILSSLTGANDTLGIYYAGLFNKHNRSAEGLRKMLTDLLNCSVQVHELQGKWTKLSVRDQTKLCSSAQPEGQYSRLGSEATLGSKAWDISSSIKVEISPNSKEQLQQLLPGTPKRELVVNLIDQYVSKAVKVRLEMKAERKFLPRTILGKAYGCLGQSARLELTSKKSLEQTSI